jgi:hypothetical protein
MDDSGNILIKRIAKTNVYVKVTSNAANEGDTAVSNDILKMPSGALDAEKPVKLFDMKKFQQGRGGIGEILRRNEKLNGNT